MNQPIDFIRKTWGKRRFERMHSNSLWQADFKLTEDDQWLLTFMDDHSRFIPGGKIEYDATTEFALKLFRKPTERAGYAPFFISIATRFGIFMKSAMSF